jgi:thiol-disulfide isomerase/thioredoxin
MFKTLCIVLIVAPAIVGQAPMANAESLAAPRLQMVNGDFYSGELKDCEEANKISWQSDAAVRPFRFALPSVAAAHFPRQGGAAPPKGDFCVELAGGDILFGGLASLSAEALELETAQFGKLRIARSQVQRLQPWGEASGIEYMGPDGLQGWTILDAASPWREEAGHPLTDKPGSIALGAAAIPKQASIEVEVSWQQKADFALQFGAKSVKPAVSAVINQFVDVAGRGRAQNAKPVEEAATAFELAVWGESVVLVREQDEDADLAPLQKLRPGAGRLSLRLHFDEDAGVVAAYTFEGKFLASVKAAGGGSDVNHGVRLINKRGDVRLERLVIRRWGGAAPPDVAGDRPYLQLRDGGVVFADAPTYDAARRQFVYAAESGERRIDAADVTGMMLPRPAQAPEFALRLSLHDGVRLNGELQKVEDGTLFLMRPGIAEAMQIPVDQVQSLVSLRHDAIPTAPAGRLGRFESAGTSSHGRLVEAESTAEASCMSWRPHGSSTSSPLRAVASGRIVYRTPPPVARPRPRVAAPRQQPGVWGAVVNAFTNPTPMPVDAGFGSPNQLLWLRAGDRIPCRVKSIDERGVTFDTPLLEATFVPHDSVKAWDGHAGSQPRLLDEQKRARLLTLPRMQRENPPTHLIESTTGDFLRGRLESMDEKFLRLEVRLETKQIPRSNVARIIWLGEGGESDPTAVEADAVAPTPERLQVQAVCRDGVRLTFEPERFADGVLIGASALLGPCTVPIVEIDQLFLGAAIADAAGELTYSEWRLRPAADPRFVTEDGQPAADGGIAGLESNLVGKPAPDFQLELADGGRFRLGEQAGRVVVIDFWATWCGWCMQSMPALDAMAHEFDDQIVWVAVNLQEDRKTIAAAMERLGINPKVALDIDGAAAEKFGVTAIPQTVVVDAEGKVSRAFIGGGPNVVEELRAAIRETLGLPAEPAGENLND